MFTNIYSQIKEFFNQFERGRNEFSVWDKVSYLSMAERRRTFVLTCSFYILAFLYFVSEASMKQSLDYFFYPLAVGILMTEPYLWIIMVKKSYKEFLKEMNVVVIINIVLLSSLILRYHNTGYIVPITLLLLLAFDLANGNPYPFRITLLLPIFIFLHHDVFSGIMVSFAILFLTFIHLEREIIGSSIIREATAEMTKEYDNIIKKLKVAANYDTLTELLNRRGMEEIVVPLFEYSQKNQLPFAFITLDVDHFKNINDTYGHEFGDKILSEISKLLRNNTRPEQDFLVRLGGEEILITSTGISTEEELEEIMARLLKKINEHEWPQHVKITASFGGCACLKNCNREGFSDFHEGVKYSDIALYQAKKNGRNCFVIFKPGI